MDNNFEDRDTALHESARKGLDEIVNVLLTAGAGLTINKKLKFNVLCLPFFCVFLTSDLPEGV
jgi:hypothetical protein